MHTETQTETAEPVLGLVRNLAHDAYLKGPGLSNSGMKTLSKSPGHFAALHLLPLPEWLIEDEDYINTASPTFAGTLCHTATLEPEAFDQRYIVGPNIDKRTKEWKTFVAANAGRVVITERQKHTALAQAASLRAVPDVADILEGGECEVSAYWLDPTTGVLCRARADCLNLNFGKPGAPAAMLLDVKTTSDLSDDALARTVWTWGYHRQATWYSAGFAIAAGMPVAGFVFAFVESTYPFAVRLFELDDLAKAIGRRENRAALDLYARCVKEKSWPSYSPAVGTLSLPYWATRGETL
jgi:exodeoxyribonuclease VIII